MQTNRLKFYNVNMKYIRNLSNVDDNVLSVSPQIGKENRPFVGILLICGKKEYCVPLSSPKPKHEKMKNDKDFSRILDKDGKLIGVLNFNMMIPVDKSLIKLANLDPSKNDSAQIAEYKQLMRDQLAWCNNNIDNITKKANRLYELVTLMPEKFRNLTRRCCDFKKLEAVLDKMMKRQKTAEYIKQNPDKTEELLKESDRIINGDPRLKKLYEATEAEYFKNTGLTPAKPTSSVADRYYERNAVISSNAKLKEEYVAVKNKIHDQSRADSLPIAPKPKKH